MAIIRVLTSIRAGLLDSRNQQMPLPFARTCEDGRPGSILSPSYTPVK